MSEQPRITCVFDFDGARFTLTGPDAVLRRKAQDWAEIGIQLVQATPAADAAEDDAEEKPSRAGASDGPFGERYSPTQPRRPDGKWGSGGSVTPEESAALSRWARTSGPIQAAAVNGGDAPALADVALMDSAMAKTPLTETTELSRGLGAPMEWDASMPVTDIDPEGVAWESKGAYHGSGLFAGATGHTPEEAFDNIGPSVVGKEFYHPGFMATSAGKNPPPEFNNKSHNVILRITAPAGTPAHRFSLDVDTPHAEREVLLGRGRTLRIVAARKTTRRDSWTNRDYDAWEIDAEVVNP